MNAVARVPRNDSELMELLEKTQRLIDQSNAQRFRHQTGDTIMREAERRGCDVVITRDPSMPGGFRIRFVPRHVPEFLLDKPAILRRQAE